MTQKRKLFDELLDGVESMAHQRTGKVTRRTHESDDLSPLEVDAVMIRHIREKHRCHELFSLTFKRFGSYT